MTSFSGLVTPDKNSMNAVLAAVALVGQEEAPVVPQGAIGGCVACGHTAASHFTVEDGKVRFLGCIAGGPSTVYILVPAHGVGQQPAPPNGHVVIAARPDGVSEDEPHQQRGFRRARYFSELHHKANPANAMNGELSDVRLKVLKAVHESGRVGLRSKEIIKRTKLTHGSVQQTLNWLRAQKLVKAAEDTSSK